MIPAWSRDFNNGERHCFYNVKDGRFEQAEFPHDECTRWRDHPYLRGNVSWMRFIRAFADQVEEGKNPFTGSGANPEMGRPLFCLFNEIDGHETSDGRHAYAESYMRLNPQDWGLHVVFRVFLANNSGWARIECYEQQYIPACEAALAAVEQSYIDEDENIGVPA